MGRSNFDDDSYQSIVSYELFAVEARFSERGLSLFCCNAPYKQ
jgi:hypothetical protein